MALILFHTRTVTNALKARAPLGIDLLVLAAVAGIAGGIVLYGERFKEAYTETVQIDLSYWSLPRYTLFSAMRGSAAYLLSLIFTLVYGTMAAHSRAAERVMIPILDILQAIPVLSFLPGTVLALIALFPTRQVGLELACILMIFTGQAWNMTFSFHGSLKSIPTALREVSVLNRYSRWQVFKWVEVPAAMIGLIWNSMMSMAGGWFFLTTVEAFTLQVKDLHRDFRLPGLGAYMAAANDRWQASGDPRPLVAGSIAIILMILAFDQLLWRPLVAWSQKFKIEENVEVSAPQSWLLAVLSKSRLFALLQRLPGKGREHMHVSRRPVAPAALPNPNSWPRRLLRWLLAGVCLAMAAAGLVALLRLIVRVPIYVPGSGTDWVTVLLALLASFGRTSAAVILGALWTLPVGILIGRSPRLSSFLQPVVQTLASYPAPMVFPVLTSAVLALHIPFNIGCVALLLLGAQWYVLFNVIAGATAIPADLTEAAVAYRMSTFQRWTRLYIPCVFPYLVTGLVTAAGGAWNATIVAEYLTIGQEHYQAFGLGAIIARASADNFPLLAASTVTMAVFVVLLNRFFWKRMYRLAEERYSLNV